MAIGYLSSSEDSKLDFAGCLFKPFFFFFSFLIEEIKYCAGRSGVTDINKLGALCS